jgi:hypothetical protein
MAILVGFAIDELVGFFHIFGWICECKPGDFEHSEDCLQFKVFQHHCYFQVGIRSDRDCHVMSDL